MQTFKQAIEKSYTFNNLFLGQLEARCEKINTDMTKLHKEAKNYGMGDYEITHLSEALEQMEEFRYMLRDEDIQNEDIQNCADPDNGDCDPGDFVPTYIEYENAVDILEKLFHGHALGYLNIPESILFKIQTLLKHRN